jgi:adenylate cyclase
LPFQNMSGDPEQEYFADGIAEDIITALSRFNQFKVIARNSTFAYKGQNVDIRQVARDLGVRYVLEGSVRRGGNRLRITGQLIEAADGTHLWADRFDGDLEDVFDLQDRITESVIGAIEPTLLTAEIERARRKPPGSLAAYDLYLQALPLLYAFRPEENDRALNLLNQAIGKDPNYALAIAHCAWGYEQRLSRGWEPHGDMDAETAIDLARKALMTSSNDPRALALAGFVLVMVARDYDRGLSAIRRADQLNPNVAFVSCLIANALTFGGEDLDHALTHLELAIRTSPGDPGAYFYWTAAAFCHYFAGRDEVAVESARQSVDMYPDWDTAYWVLIPALTRLGRMDEARSAVEKLHELSPHLTGDILRRTAPFRDGNKLEEIVNGLSHWALIYAGAW